MPKKELPEICNDEKEVQIINHADDVINGRSFQDNPDLLNNEQLHTIFLLPCEMEDRKFDVNLNIDFSL